MKNLNEVRERYPTANYPTHPECCYCNGTGERSATLGELPCYCIYISHDYCHLVAESLRRVVKELGRKHEHRNNDQV